MQPTSYQRESRSGYSTLLAEKDEKEKTCHWKSLWTRRFSLLWLSLLPPSPGGGEEAKGFQVLIMGLNLRNISKAFAVIVTRLCEGGELLDKILSRGRRYSKEHAKVIVVQNLSIVSFCHLQGVVHRILKIENFLFSTKDEKLPLKAIDFGLSDFIKPDERLNDIVGSAYYVALEVLRSYSMEVDFKLLEPNKEERISIQNFKLAVMKNATDAMKESKVPDMLNSMNQLAFKIMDFEESCAVAISIYQLEALDQHSTEDKGASQGEMTKDSLLHRSLCGLGGNREATFKPGREALDRLGDSVELIRMRREKSKVEHLADTANVNGNGTIDHLEFIIAAMYMNRMDREDHLYIAFQYFDKDNNGYITIVKLEQALKRFRMGDRQTIKDIIAEEDAPCSLELISKPLSLEKAYVSSPIPCSEASSCQQETNPRRSTVVNLKKSERHDHRERLNEWNQGVTSQARDPIAKQGRE
eukprot:Gb_37734 [translate_table: standard]